MTKDELKLAFQKAFQMGQDYWYHADHEFESYNKKSDAIRAKFNEMVEETIKEALAQPEQEPKCGAIIEVFGKDWRLDYMSLPVGKHKLYTQQYTYTTPPERTWVGLDEEDDIDWEEGGSLRDLVEAVEAKLKEKNNG